MDHEARIPNSSPCHALGWPGVSKTHLAQEYAHHAAQSAKAAQEIMQSLRIFATFWLLVGRTPANKSSFQGHDQVDAGAAFRGAALATNLIMTSKFI